MTSSLVSAPPNMLFKMLMFDILGPESDLGAGGSSGRNLGSGTPSGDGEERLVGVDGVGEVRGAGGLAWPRRFADVLAWPGWRWRVADGLAGGRGEAEALDGVELGEDVLEHSPLRKEVILEPAIA